MSPDMLVEFPYLMEDWDRHGNGRLYVRFQGKKIRLRAVPGTEAFAQAYAEALYRLQHAKGELHPLLERISVGTLGWLAACYFNSPEFKRMDERSRVNRRRIIEDCLREPRHSDTTEQMRFCPLAIFSAAHVKLIRDRKSDLPGAANNRRKYLSSMFGWAVEHGHMRFNPARDVRRISYPTDGFHTWTLDEILQFEERWPIGTKPRLAFALLLFLGVRRGDVVRLGRQHVKNGSIQFVPNKTRHKRRTLSKKPILKILADIIAQSPTGALTFLETAYGKPFSDAGFGAWFKDRCCDAGLPHCTAHGLRKAGATIAAENGATDRQLMALYDWTTANMATTYTKSADQERLAADAAKLIADQMGNAEAPHLLPHQNKSSDGTNG